MEYQKRIYFCTSNKKNIYRQLKSNPQLQGKAVFDSNSEAKDKAFEVMPGLAKIYKSEDFEVFYVEGIEATMYSMKDEPRTITL